MVRDFSLPEHVDPNQLGCQCPSSRRGRGGKSHRSAYRVLPFDCGSNIAGIIHSALYILNEIAQSMSAGKNSREPETPFRRLGGAKFG